MQISWVKLNNFKMHFKNLIQTNSIQASEHVIPPKEADGHLTGDDGDCTGILKNITVGCEPKPRGFFSGNKVLQTILLVLVALCLIGVVSYLAFTATLDSSNANGQDSGFGPTKSPMSVESTSINENRGSFIQKHEEKQNTSTLMTILWEVLTPTEDCLFCGFPACDHHKTYPIATPEADLEKGESIFDSVSNGYTWILGTIKPSQEQKPDQSIIDHFFSNLIGHNQPEPKKESVLEYTSNHIGDTSNNISSTISEAFEVISSIVNVILWFVINYILYPGALGYLVLTMLYNGVFSAVTIRNSPRKAMSDESKRLYQYLQKSRMDFLLAAVMVASVVTCVYLYSGYIEMRLEWVYISAYVRYPRPVQPKVLPKPALNAFPLTLNVLIGVAVTCFMTTVVALIYMKLKTKDHLCSTYAKYAMVGVSMVIATVLAMTSGYMMFQYFYNGVTSITTTPPVPGPTQGTVPESTPLTGTDIFVMIYLILLVIGSISYDYLL
uniref:Uncharacterized protein n=2 Tax=Clytia hemisphaerica TaxID=252671 RepID=A0A7M5XE78_9CNID